jgi:hypothetical protein
MRFWIVRALWRLIRHPRTYQAPVALGVRGAGVTCH